LFVILFVDYFKLLYGNVAVLVDTLSTDKMGSPKSNVLSLALFYLPPYPTNLASRQCLMSSQHKVGQA